MKEEKGEELTENAEPLLLHEILFDAAGLEAYAAVGEKVGVAHGEWKAEDTAVRVNYVNECSIRGTESLLLRLEIVEWQRGIQT